MIPNCIPNISGREREYLLEALDGNHLATGPFIERFEQYICGYTGAAHAVAVSSGSAALHLALLAAGVGADDEVLVPALTFAATANAVRYCGAWPLFTDCDPLFWGMDAAQLANFLEDECERRDGVLVNRATGRRIAAMVPVHLYGHPADMDPLIEISRKYGIALVEDGAEALGATYKGRPVGSLHETCILSFNGNKVITAGGGGMVLTADETIARRCRYLANQAKADSLDFVHETIGFNYRMPNLNAALALAQAESLERFVAAKRAVAQGYETRLDGMPGCRMRRSSNEAESAHWMAVLELDAPEAEQLIEALVAKGVGARPTWRPLNRQRAFADAASLPTPVSEALYRSTVCLPCSSGISESDLDRVADAVRAVIGP